MFKEHQKVILQIQVIKYNFLKDHLYNQNLYQNSLKVNLVGKTIEKTMLF